MAKILSIILAAGLLLSGCDSGALTSSEPATSARAWDAAPELPVWTDSEVSEWKWTYADETCDTATFRYEMDIIPSYRAFYLYAEDHGTVLIDRTFKGSLSGRVVVDKFPPPHENQINVKLSQPRLDKWETIEKWHSDIAPASC